MSLLFRRSRTRVAVGWSARYSSRMTDSVETPYRLITDPLRERAAATPDRVFCHSGAESLTYRQLWSEVRRVAGGLQALGVGRGTRVALVMDNGPRFLTTWFALALIGAVEVPVNTAFHGASLRYVLEQSGCAAVVVDDRYADRVSALGPLDKLLICDADERAAAAWTELDGEPDESFDGTTEPAAIMYTSGTTGRSKGVVLSHRYFLLMAAANIRNMRLGEDDVYYTCLPLFHGMAQLSGTMAPLIAGAELVVAQKFSASRFWDDCRRYGVTGFGSIAAITSMLYNRPAEPGDRDHRVRFAFAVAVPAAVERRFEERFGVRLINGYGITEAGQVTYQPYDAPKPGSAGTPVGLYELEIHDPHDRPLGPGEKGEIVVRPRQNSAMMAGYHAMPEATVEAFRNLWLHTGDLGYRDADGYLYFVDRGKDAIRRRGENISSLEVEAAVVRHPGVAEVAAYPVPSGLGEDEVMIAVIRADEALTAAELARHCAAELPRFAVPAYIRFVGALPRTPTAKVEKYRLRAEGVTGDTHHV
ncbi:ATP-dependent acyl-CoA ligase [Actinomadura sp. 7K534]|nr:ATP-dependent acyl-CoA ligase [Actinomadura sp. 7K534]